VRPQGTLTLYADGDTTTPVMRHRPARSAAEMARGRLRTSHVEGPLLANVQSRRRSDALSDYTPYLKGVPPWFAARGQDVAPLPLGGQHLPRPEARDDGGQSRSREQR